MDESNAVITISFLIMERRIKMVDDHNHHFELAFQSKNHPFPDERQPRNKNDT